MLKRHLLLKKNCSSLVWPSPALLPLSQAVSTPWGALGTATPCASHRALGTGAGTETFRSLGQESRKSQEGQLSALQTRSAKSASA